MNDLETHDDNDFDFLNMDVDDEVVPTSDIEEEEPSNEVLEDLPDIKDDLHDIENAEALEGTILDKKPPIKPKEKKEKTPTKLPQLSALDAMIGNFQSKLNVLKEQQAKIAEKSKEESPLNLIESDPTKTYSHIEEALVAALEILQNAKLFVENTPDGEGFSAAASVISSVQSLFKEFTSIWQKQMNYQNAVNLEAIKLQNKKELETHKMQLKLKYFNQTTSKDMSNGNTSIPFNTKEFIDAISG